MKRFLVSTRVSLFPPEHGGAKNIRQIVETLALDGVECRVLVKLHPPAKERHRFAGQFGRQGRWTHEGVSYEGVVGTSDDLAIATRREIEGFRPDGVLLCDDALDDGTKLFEAAAQTDNFIFLAQTIHCLPFGPYAMKKSPAITESVRRAKLIITPSRYVQDYVRKHLGRESVVRTPNVFGAPPFPLLGHSDNEFITMVNPCPWKGSSLFLKIAKARPNWKFAAVPTWGATPSLLDELKALPNVSLLEETSNIDEIFARTKVLLAPSLCQEAFGLVSPEALLRGVPVVASDIAGLRESTLGVAPLIPVTELSFDNPPSGPDHTKYVWKEPENDVEPWLEALDTVLGSYDEYSRRGKQAAENFVSGLTSRIFQ